MRTRQKLLQQISYNELASKKRKLDLTLESIGVSPVNICGFAQHSCTCAKGKLKKALNVYKENISAALISVGLPNTAMLQMQKVN